MASQNLRKVCELFLRTYAPSLCTEKTKSRKTGTCDVYFPFTSVLTIGSSALCQGGHCLRVLAHMHGDYPCGDSVPY